MASDHIDKDIAELAHEIARRIPDDGEGLIAIKRCKDEEYIRGDRVGLLTLGAAILLRITAGETAYQPLQNKMNRMFPDGPTYIVLPVTDDREITKLRHPDKMPWWMCVLLKAVILLFAALVGLGLYTIWTWVR